MKCHILAAFGICFAAITLPFPVVFAAEVASTITEGTAPASTRPESNFISSAPSKPPVLTRELIALIQQRKVVELRTIYNGPFAAALFFNPENLEYYVALLKHNNFWWISRTKNHKDAEDLYSKMATQTIQLAAPTLEKIQLDARIALTKRKLAEAQQKQAALAEQIDIQNRIVREGTAAQSQLNAQAQQLAEQRAQLERELAEVNSTIQALQSATSKGPDISVSWPKEAAGAQPLVSERSLQHSKPNPKSASGQ